jgi:uncharacterized protein
MSAATDRYRIGVIADTHGHLAAAVPAIFAGVQLILHAGDIGMGEVLAELETIAPVCAVSGNVDGLPDARLRPLFRQLETPAGRIAMTHGHLSLAPSNDPARLVRHFAPFRPDIIVYGHSHIAYLGQCEGVTLFNPGAAGHAGFGRQPSVGLITVDAPGVPPRLEHVVLT